MSEYQYYEFRAIDKTLTAKEMQELRAISTRARITASSFINHYDYGDLKADPIKMLEKYFDAYYYYSDFGSYALGFRFPKKSINVKEIKQYFISSRVMFLKETKDYIVIYFYSDDEDFADKDYEEEFPQLASFISLRNDILAGDYRSLYLAYLKSEELEPKKRKTVELEVPSGLGKLTPVLSSFAEFLRLDEKKIEAAAKKSGPVISDLENDKKLKQWISGMSADRKDEILFSFIKESNPMLRMELLQEYRKQLKAKQKTPPGSKKKSGKK